MGQLPITQSDDLIYIKLSIIARDQDFNLLIPLCLQHPIMADILQPASGNFMELGFTVQHQILDWQKQTPNEVEVVDPITHEMVLLDVWIEDHW